MSEPLHVLVWGHVQEGACAYFRGYQYDEPLRALGVEMKHISGLDGSGRVVDREGNDVDLTGIDNIELGRRIHTGEWRSEFHLDLSPIEWADVIVFRRYYNTSMKCETCGFLTHDVGEFASHPHRMKQQDDITRVMWPAIAQRTDKAILYETDDLHLGHGVQKWNGYWKDVAMERDLVMEMTRRADLVTVSTPPLAATYGHYTPRLRVIRNAIDPDLYITDAQRPDTKTRLLYYGNTARLRDYLGSCERCGFGKMQCFCGGKRVGGFASLAVEEQKRDLHRIFIGTTEGTEDVVGEYFDEQHGFIEDIPAFSRKLAEVRGDIGMAPVVGDAFDQAKSELHWLEYSMAGCATIATRMMGDGPYNVIRDGVDGILARGRQDWSDALKRLMREPNLRADLAGAAKERVVAEYDYRKRAEEWAAALYWAADHAGIGAAVAA